MPLIIVDLFIYITGQEKLITKAMKCLNERVPAMKSNLNKKLKYGEDLPDPKKGFGALSQLSTQLVDHFQKKVFEKIPPLKEFPEEILSEDSNISEKSDYVLKKTTLNNKIKYWKDEFEEVPEMVLHLENCYRTLSTLKSHKTEKDLREDEERYPVCDYVMTEKSILDGWKDVTGSRCDIFSKVFYLHASKMQDYAKLDFMDFLRVVMPLYENNFVKRNRHVFDLLDIDKDGELDIISMIQIYKYLPDRCLLKYEVLLLLDEYKNRNVIHKRIGRHNPLDFNKFNKIVPQSTIAKALQFSFFGHTIPVVTTGTHLVKPVCPFHNYKSLNDLKVAVLKSYPSREGSYGVNPTLILDNQGRVEFMDE